MLKLYTFTLQQEIEKDKVETSTDATGAKIEKTTKVKEPITRTFFIKRPTATQTNNSEEFRAVEESNLIRKGVITIPLMTKKILEDGDIYTEKQKKRLLELQESFAKLNIELTDLVKIDEKDRNDEQKEKIKELEKQQDDILIENNELQKLGNGLFDRTAEVLARNRQILWLTLELSYEEKDGKNVPIFSGDKFEDKFNKYSDLEERQEDFEYELFKKLQYVVGLWFFGKATAKDEFDAMLRLFENKEIFNV